MFATEVAFHLLHYFIVHVVACIRTCNYNFAPSFVKVNDFKACLVPPSQWLSWLHHYFTCDERSEKRNISRKRLLENGDVIIGLWHR